MVMLIVIPTMAWRYIKNKKNIKPALPILDLSVRQDREYINRSANLVVKMPMKNIQSEPVEFSIQKIKSWKFKIASCPPVDSWKKPNDEAILVSSSTKNSNPHYVYPIKTDGEYKMSISIYTDEIIENGLDSSIYGFYVFLLKVTISVKNYLDYEVNIIVSLEGGFTRQLLNGGVTKDDLVAQINYIDEIVSAAAHGVVIDKELQQQLLEMKEQIMKIVNKC